MEPPPRFGLSFNQREAGMELRSMNKKESTVNPPETQREHETQQEHQSRVSSSASLASMATQQQQQQQPGTSPARGVQMTTAPAATSSIPRAAIPTLPEGDVPDNLHTPFVHLYRAELGRVAAYRQRLDTVTNWAISLTGLLVTFTLSRDAIPHSFFSIILLLNVLFLYTESRRYTFYELALRRCRIVETGWTGIITHSPTADLQWKQKLGAAYGTHPGLLPFKRSCLIRLQRNYVWMFWIVMVGWTIKLSNLDDFPWSIYLSILAILTFTTVFLLSSKFHSWLDV